MRRFTRRDKDSGPDHGANAQRGQVHWSECPFKAIIALHIRQQHLQRLRGEQLFSQRHPHLRQRLMAARQFTAEKASLSIVAAIAASSGKRSSSSASLRALCGKTSPPFHASRGKCFSTTSRNSSRVATRATCVRKNRAPYLPWA